MLRVLFLCLLALSAVAQTPISPDDRALYGVINRASGRCLDVARAAIISGAPTVQWEFTHAPSQQWRLMLIREGGEYYRLEAKHSGQCLTLEITPTAPPGANTPLIQRPFTGGLGQQWRLVATGQQPGTFQLENRLDGRVATLATNDKFNNTSIVAARGVGRASQQWHLFQLQLRLATGPPYFAAPEPLPALNSPTGNEYQPVPTPDGKGLYFGRTRFAGNTEGAAESGDIWLSQTTDEGRTWAAPARPDSPAGLNTAQNNAVQAVVGTTSNPALLLRGTYDAAGFRDEGLSRVAVAGSGRPTPVRVAGYGSSSPATNFFMTADEKILLLSLEREDSQGANDLYLSRPDGAGGYTAPQSLGAVVNSPGYEFAPWLAADGKTLYFASYGHQGYGSADIFVSQRLDDSWTKWSQPQNLGPRFNGTGYDAFFALGPNGTAYYTTTGSKDTAPKKLFRTPPGAPPVVDSTAILAAAADPSSQPRALVTGRVLDGRTNQPLAGGAEVQALMIGGAIDFRSTARADITGFQMSLAPGRYRMTTTAGLLTRVDTLVVGAGESRRYEPRLTPATVGSRLDLPDLLFAQGQAKLIGSSYPTLNRLAESMKDNPLLEIRLEGHTSNEPPADKNQVLSEQRVAEVKRYLVGRGVAEARITTVGFGGSKPKFSNDREETRKLNRRVELVITK
ncbi:OmpA family protein [Hymenobacter sp. HMF4947]|uniref:OmpA family protein n=1 Tax=Hymenobacter ginkgonis TaxID=2682976 RepID=A0A7K1TIE0_9BACT|nr:RICIN domain-containing protein [Hymenobacter ginkgonis]MVN78179.1 OmpA family protein [Hymenobacter ginkgonis]